MSLPLILEELYLKAFAKKTFPSGVEDSRQAAADLLEVSQFFSEVSERQSDARISDNSDKRLLNLLKSYKGPRVNRVRIEASFPNVS